MEELSQVVVSCNFTEQEFELFAIYEAYFHKKSWRPPLIFAIFMFFLAAVCLALPNGPQTAQALGFGLLVAGILIPISNFLFFMVSVVREARKHRLGRDKVQYTLRLDKAGVSLFRGGETAAWPWEDVSALALGRRCAFLYLRDRMAFILPEGESLGPALELIKKRISHEKIIAIGRKKGV